MVEGGGGISPMILMPPLITFSAPQQAKRLPPPTISLRSKSMTSELEEMGEPVGLLRPGGRGERGRRAGPSLEFVSVVSDQGSLSSSCPQYMGRTLACVCVSLGRGV